jgi:glutamate-ammonia-ligase adenylyltransferase
MEEAEREAYLMTKGIIDTGEALRNVARIKESVSSFHSLKGRRVLKEIAPGLVEAALSTSSPDRALKNLVHFLEMVSLNEAYLLSFRENIDLGNALVDVFSHSDYLSKLILSNPGYLDMLSGGTPKRKPLSRMKSELSGMVDTAVPLNTAVRVFKRSEEIRIGLMYLSKVVGVRSLMRGLSKVAEAVVDYAMKAVCEELALSPGNEVCVTAMGKFGGREITIGSDLDILFYVPGDLLEEHAKAAERFLKAMQLYTSDGIAYKVDTRLRPDGSKGPLISSIQGYGDYYRKNASNWEIQALLKARPVSSSRKGLCAFMEMREEAIRGRAPAISGEEILKMRTRIMTELGSPKGGIDIKIHKGGIGEIEFLVQFLQLKNAGRMVLYQDTLRALKILGESGTLAENDVSYLKESYLIYREIETYLRLSIMNTIKESDQETRYLAAFLGSGSVDEFIKGLRERMVRVSGIADRIYGQ